MAIASGDGRKPGTSGRRPAAKRSASAKHINPVASQRELGQLLRDLRNGLGLTVQEVGDALMCSATKISRLETGARRANPRDIRDLCRLYGIADQAKADELMELARQARETPPWTQYEEVIARLFGIEREAASITSYSMFHVPGLLQTGAYARAIIKGIERRIEPEILEQRIEARLRRQDILEADKAPHFRTYIDEAVLRRQVGGPAVMYNQIDKILSRVRDEKVIIQVIAFEAGAHASLDSNFDLFQFGNESQQRPVVFVEGLLRDRYFERPAEIARYQEALEYLRDAALTPWDSASLIKEIQRAHV